MTTVAQLKEQRAQLDDQIAELVAEKKADIIEEIKQAIADYAITPEEVFPGIKLRKRPGKAAQIKFRDPQSGKSWSGRGKIPVWLQGKNVEDFRV